MESNSEQLIGKSLGMSSNSELENALLVTALRTKIRLCSLQRETIYAVTNELVEAKQELDEIKSYVEESNKEPTTYINPNEIEQMLMPAHFSFGKNKLAYSANNMRVDITPVVSALYPYNRVSTISTASNQNTSLALKENDLIEYELDTLLNSFESDAMIIKQTSNASTEMMVKKALMKKQMKDMKKILQKVKNAQISTPNNNININTSNNIPPEVAL